MSRRAVILVVAIACGLIGWAGWRFLSGATREGGSPTQALGPQGASAPAESRGVEARPDSRAEGSLRPRRFTESEPAAASRAAVPATHTLGVSFEPEGTPAAGAIVEVVVLDDRELPPRSEWGDLAALHPAEIVADVEGAVLLPPFKDGAFVRARCAGRAAERWIRGMQAETRLVLRLPIAVLVVDQAGAPQGGVPVVVMEDSGETLPLQRGNTRQDGLASLEIPHPNWTDDQDRGELTTCFVAIALPLAEPVEKVLDPLNLPPMPMELVLPPTGRVAANLVTADGKPFTEPALVWISSKSPARRRVGGDTGEISARAENGRASFSMIPLAGDVLVRAIAKDETLRDVEAELAGPRAAESAVVLVCGHLATLVTGRLVDSTGAPVPNAVLDAWLPDPSGEDEPASIHRAAFAATRRDGRFTLRFNLDPARATATEIEVNIMGAQELGAVRKTRPVTLPPEVRKGSADVGDVVLVREELIASGVVVNEEGAPIGKAFVSVEVRSASGAWGYTEVSAHCDDTGRFELRGAVDGSQLGIRATGEGWSSVEPTRFEKGATEVRVVVTRTGSIEGSIAHGKGKSWSPFDQSAPIGVTIERKGSRYELGIEDGIFKAEQLLSGTYTVTITTRGSEEPLLTVADIVVKAGEVNRDPRLQNIDLSKLLTVRVVTVLDEQGQPIQDASVAVVVEKRQLMVASTDAKGHATVYSRAATFGIVVATPGYRAVTRAPVTGDVTVVLRKAAPLSVTVVLPSAEPAPPPGTELAVQLVWLGDLQDDEPVPSNDGWDDPRTESFTLYAVGKDLKATVPVQNPGVYEVRAYLQGHGLRGGLATLDQEGGKGTVRVTDDAPSSVRLKFAAGAMKNAIEELKKE